MIITVTLNPAMDRVLVLDRFRLNVTNRITRQFDCVGGKGTHVSINLSMLGVRSRAVGVVMGGVGRDILASLRAMNIDVRFLELPEGNSRINFVLVDGEHNCTLISEKGQRMSDTVIENLLSLYTSLVAEGDIVVISGDASNQSGTVLQDTLMDIAGAKKAAVCLDASGDNLAAGIRKGPWLIKPNVDELENILGRTINSEEKILDGIGELNSFGIRYIVVSRGGEGSLVYADGKYFRVTAPDVEVRNTVGCGDALLAGLLAGFEKGMPVEANLRQATAAAAAKAMNESTAGFEAGLVAELGPKVRVEALTGVRKFHSN
ncbi:MAG: hypothetical protein E4H36_04980 [Spirochaetales bacterium]|nr:MAG: hypothetical protein E4H36_04980 [Spirochaetales bacterium]